MERPCVPRTVWVLGFVSLLMDTSSEMVHGLLPVFMVSALGAGAFSIGLVEGVAESTALIAKVFSGAFSDRLRRRKGLAVGGYGLAAASKPLFALAGSVGGVLGARFMDRIGKGIRGAPRDALIADVTPPSALGAAYGLRQALDTVGAILGPLAAMGLMVALAGDFRAVFWWASVPAVLSVLLLVFGVSEGDAPAKAAPATSLRWATLERFSAGYWKVVSVGAVFAAARFSEAFLILRATHNGLSDAMAPMVLIVMNVAYAASAYPAGRLSDRISPRWLLGAGLAVLIAADLALAHADGLLLAGAGIVLWGLHLGLTQGVLSALVAGVAPADLRGTAFGIFNLASGLAMLAANPLAGVLWDRFGAPAAFYTGAGFSLAAFLLLLA